MIRRSPTRIELRLDDLNEFNMIRREFEANQRAGTGQSTPAWATNNAPQKTKQEVIHERIGYTPQPRPTT
ncbi:anaphase-promoting complex subunit CDC26-like [Lycorma delicatula]|uniref:anaphase-promoting complex subunit CDC26-like n=1 Tax=Lycorma delicatula TaxID=130591 RepID=UPI003F5136A6